MNRFLFTLWSISFLTLIINAMQAVILNEYDIFASFAFLGAFLYSSYFMWGDNDESKSRKRKGEGGKH